MWCIALLYTGYLTSFDWWVISGLGEAGLLSNYREVLPTPGTGIDKCVPIKSMAHVDILGECQSSELEPWFGVPSDSEAGAMIAVMSSWRLEVISCERHFAGSMNRRIVYRGARDFSSACSTDDHPQHNGINTQCLQSPSVSHFSGLESTPNSAVCM